MLMDFTSQLAICRPSHFNVYLASKSTTGLTTGEHVERAAASSHGNVEMVSAQPVFEYA